MYNNPPKTLFVGQNRLFLPECHSTNDIAAELGAQASTPEGTVVITANQTRGRGQRGNTWLAEPGKNLTFSVVLRPVFLPPADQFLLNITVSLAIQRFLSAYLPQHLSVKWPNDVYWQDRKLGGVLIENTLQGSRLAQSVVGIGLNINQRRFADGLRATSLALATAAYLLVEDDYDLEILLPQLLLCLEQYYLKLRAGEAGSLRAEYLRILYGYGENRLFRAENRVFEGKIIDVDHDGRLVVQTHNSIRRFAFKEIEMVFGDA